MIASHLATSGHWLENLRLPIPYHNLTFHLSSLPLRFRPYISHFFSTKTTKSKNHPTDFFYFSTTIKNQTRIWTNTINHFFICPSHYLQRLHLSFEVEIKKAFKKKQPADYFIHESQSQGYGQVCDWTPLLWQTECSQIDVGAKEIGIAEEYYCKRKSGGSRSHDHREGKEKKRNESKNDTRANSDRKIKGNRFLLRRAHWPNPRFGTFLSVQNRPLCGKDHMPTFVEKSKIFCKYLNLLFNFVVFC